MVSCLNRRNSVFALVLDSAIPLEPYAGAGYHELASGSASQRTGRSASRSSSRRLKLIQMTIERGLR
jgi:hypothetical protein